MRTSRVCWGHVGVAGRDLTVQDFPETYIGSGVRLTPQYTPPSGATLIWNHLHQWEAFLHAKDDLDPLLKMSMAHYPFEAIHPFADGDGRTGRILNILLLANYGLLTHPILYMSERII
ncbi:Fic family protein [Leucobacter insecticola]|uniref:Fic family protein n=1 Tax=Leucobacter insecticola TaxID=2714934 RepID=UPI001981F0E7|nr:Fic family protein [Leucobacter insecticola]